MQSKKLAIVVSMILLNAGFLTGCNQSTQISDSLPKSSGEPYPPAAKVSQYPGSNCKMFKSATSDIPGGGKLVMSTIWLTTQDAPEKVYAFYKSDLANKGYQVKEDPNGTLSSNKGDDSVSVACTRNGDETEVMVIQN